MDIQLTNTNRVAFSCLSDIASSAIAEFSLFFVSYTAASCLLETLWQKYASRHTVGKHRSSTTCLIRHSVFRGKYHGTPVHFAHVGEKQHCISVSPRCIMPCICAMRHFVRSKYVCSCGISHYERD